MKKLISLLLVLALAAALAACNNSASSTPGAASTLAGSSTADAAGQPSDGDGKTHVVYVGGKLGDAGIADATYEGFTRALEELPIYGEFIELPTDVASYRTTMLEACETDASLIFTSAGSGMIDVVIELAPQYPDKKFMVLDTPIDQEGISDMNNFYGILCAQNEVSFLTGYLAQRMSETDKVGVVVGVEYPVLCDFVTGYISGAQAANPNVQIAVSASGDWVDQGAAKETALAQIRQGCDVIYCVGAASSFGSLEACKEEGVWGIGCDTDLAAQFIGIDDEQADCIITSAYKDWGQVSYDWIKTCLEDINAVPWGTVHLTGIADGGCKIIQNEIYDKQVPEEIKDEMEQLIADISSGKVQCPTYFDMTEEEYVALKESVMVK